MKTYIMHIMAIAIAMPLLASAADKSTGWSVPEPDRRDASIDARQHCRPMLLWWLVNS